MGETPITHLDQLLESQGHHWIGSIWAGVPVWWWVSPVNQGRTRSPHLQNYLPLHSGKREKKRSWGRSAPRGVSHILILGPGTSSPVYGVWGMEIVPEAIPILIPAL